MEARRAVGAKRANGGTASTGQTSSGRMPQAPASLLVQLPPDQLQHYANNRAALQHHLQAGPSTFRGSYNPDRRSSSSNNEVTAVGGGPVQASDIALLAASIQERREREAHTFTWQQRLIGAQTVEREILKRALTQLSLPAWLQVLQERHLADRCAYPTCARVPIKRHLSRRQANPALPLDAPRYRISLRRRAIERDERDDAGGQNGFCSNTCWRRGEWISRWVLNGGKSTRQVQRDVSDEAFGSAIRDLQGLGREVDEGGRWERIMDEEHWTEIELLEDLEDKGEVDRLSDDERDAQPPSTSSSKASSPMLDQHDNTSNGLSAASDDDRDVLRGQASAVAREHARKRAQNKGTAEGFLDMLDSLVIQERQQTSLSTTEARCPNTSHTPYTTDEYKGTGVESDDIVDELKPSLSRTVRHAAGGRIERDALYDAEGDVSMSDEATTTSADDDDVDERRKNDSGGRRQRLTKEEQTQRREEDDLFAQAWQAMSDEKAKGTWDV